MYRRFSAGKERATKSRTDDRRVHPPSPLPEHLKNQIKQLHQRDPDGDIHRNLQPPARLFRAREQLDHFLGALMQGLRQLLEVLRRSSQFLQHVRSRRERRRHLFAIANIKFRLASRPPQTPRRIVVHPLPNLLIRPAAQKLHQPLNLIRPRRRRFFESNRHNSRVYQPSPHPRRYPKANFMRGPKPNPTQVTRTTLAARLLAVLSQRAGAWAAPAASNPGALGDLRFPPRHLQSQLAGSQPAWTPPASPSCSNPFSGQPTAND